MNLILFGIWDIPVSTYLIIYLGLGILGFLLCYFHKYFIFAVFPVLLWLCISDFNQFYSNQITPHPQYVFQVVLAMITAFSATIFGTILNRRKLKNKFPNLL